MKKCGICKIEKDSSEFGRDKNTRDGLNYYCKVCIRIRSANQRKSNPEYAKKYAEEYRKKNRGILRRKAWLTYYIDWDKRAEQGRKHYQKHKERIARERAEKRRTEQGKEKERIRQKAWRKKNPSRAAKIVRGWEQRNPQKAAAHKLVLWAIRSGELTRPEKCEECGSMGKIEGHHENYLKPMEVRWLCKTCHANIHRIYR